MGHRIAGFAAAAATSAGAGSGRSGVGALTMRVLDIMFASAFQVDEFLQDFIAGGDDSGAGLKAALGGDEVGKFIRQIHVG